MNSCKFSDIADGEIFWYDSGRGGMVEYVKVPFDKAVCIHTGDAETFESICIVWKISSELDLAA